MFHIKQYAKIWLHSNKLICNFQITILNLKLYWWNWWKYFEKNYIEQIDTKQKPMNNRKPNHKWKIVLIGNLKMSGSFTQTTKMLVYLAKPVSMYNQMSEIMSMKNLTGKLFSVFRCPLNWETKFWTKPAILSSMDEFQCGLIINSSRFVNLHLVIEYTTYITINNGELFNDKIGNGKKIDAMDYVI